MFFKESFYSVMMILLYNNILLLLLFDNGNCNAIYNIKYTSVELRAPLSAQYFS